MPSLERIALESFRRGESKSARVPNRSTRKRQCNIGYQLCEKALKPGLCRFDFHTIQEWFEQHSWPAFFVARLRVDQSRKHLLAD
jgi:hypothetical protein